MQKKATKLSRQRVMRRFFLTTPGATGALFFALCSVFSQGCEPKSMIEPVADNGTCLADQDCLLGQACVDKKCVNTCQIDADCEVSSESCQEGLCQPWPLCDGGRCALENDAAANPDAAATDLDASHSSDDAATDGCGSGPACEDGFACLDGLCRIECRSRQQCLSDQVCSDYGLCTPPALLHPRCSALEPCDAGFECVEDRCAPLCELGSCANPIESCVLGLCIVNPNPSCFSDTDCSASGLCMRSHCLGGECEETTEGAGVLCDDGNLCTSNDRCNGQGQCVGDIPECSSPPPDSCSADDTTFRVYPERGLCDRATGECVYSALSIPCSGGCLVNCLESCAALHCESTACSIGVCIGGNPPSCLAQPRPDDDICRIETEYSGQGATGVCVDGSCHECSAGSECPAADAEYPECFAPRCSAEMSCAYDLQPEIECEGQSCSAAYLSYARQCGDAGACPAAGGQTCNGYTCNETGSACRSTCSEHAHCADGFRCLPDSLGVMRCVGDGLPDGAACRDSGASCQSGYCDGALCCQAGSCCNVASDCPAQFSTPAFCNDNSDNTDCQGAQQVALCIDHQCSSQTIENDSACAGLLHSCPEHLASLRCFDSVDQLVPVCASQCASNADCVSGYVCDLNADPPACVADVNAACTVVVAPSASGLNEQITVLVISPDALTCSYRVDGLGLARPIACNQIVQLDTRELGAIGSHTLIARASTASSTGDCEADFAVLPEPVCALAPTPQSVTLDETVTVSMSVANATSCSYTINGVYQGSVDCTNQVLLRQLGSVFGPDDDYVIELNATGGSGVSACVTTVTVASPIPPATCSAAFSPATINFGESASVSVSSQNNNDQLCSYTCDGAIQSFGELDCNSLVDLGTGMAPGITTCTVTVYGNDGVASNGSCEASLTVNPPPEQAWCNVQFNPTTIDFGDAANLTINSGNTNDQGCTFACTGAMQIDGSMSCSDPIDLGTNFPVGQTTCVVTAHGDGGDSTCAAFIQVNTPPEQAWCNAQFTPATVDFGDAAMLTINSGNTDGGDCDFSCTGAYSGSGVIACSGDTDMGTTMPVGTTSCTITAHGPGGDNTCPASITVNQPLDSAWCNAQFVPSTIAYGQSASVTVNSGNTNEQDCTYDCTGAFEGSGIIPCSGSTDLGAWTVVGTTDCTVNVFGDGGNDSCPARITTTPPPAPTCSISFNPADGSGRAGQTFTANWSNINDATTCDLYSAGTFVENVPCNTGSETYPDVAAGSYNLEMRMTGPTGLSGSCSANIAITEPAPTCTMRISERDAGTLTVLVSSDNATSCISYFNDVEISQPPCGIDSVVYSDADPGPGGVVRTDLTGPGGTGTCSLDI